jgi:hypothetical protein
VDKDLGCWQDGCRGMRKRVYDGSRYREEFPVRHLVSLIIFLTVRSFAFDSPTVERSLP